MPYFISTTLSLCTLAIFLSVAISFLEHSKKDEVKKEKKSIVETGTMTGFFVMYYLIIRFHLGTITMSSQRDQVYLIAIGIVVIVVGTLVNVIGRYQLGKNWANQIKIYKDHQLMTSGMFKIVRHPLYASLIWIFFGASFIYQNWLAFLLNSFIFLPFMYYRAKQEESLLKKEFPDYGTYTKRVGMFFPKIPKLNL
jgi:protein-S-isoprenylcysteine O-methyltransferase Ste14